MRFFKTTITAGFFIIIPVLLAYLLFVESLEIIHVISDPLHDLIFGGYSESLKGSLILDILLLVLVSFLLGTLAYSDLGKRIGSWIERKLLVSIPLYSVTKQFSQAFSGKQQHNFQPALLKQQDDIHRIVFIVEESTAGQCTVFLPNSPMPTTGSVRIVDKSLLSPLDASFSEVMNSLWQFGIGTQDLIQAEKNNG